MRLETIIGLELHIQLTTNSKLFSSSATTFGQSPNTLINEIDLGYPGVLPVLNKRAVELAIAFAIAIDAEVNKNAFFMRKNYFYPDLPKGYQISQLDDAIIKGGKIEIDMGDYQRLVRINRGQLEEDAGKSIHDIFNDKSAIDLNRAGVALIELVSEPDLRSAKEAVAYMKLVHELVRYLEISDGNMQEGSFRCDANVSLRPLGSDIFNPRVELKNINSFKFVEQAINLEIARQSEIYRDGGKVEQETRLFDAQLLETRSMRSKEEAFDYRYFPDPDLLPLAICEQTIADIKNSLPELPQRRIARWCKEWQIDKSIAQFFMQHKTMADYYEQTVNAGADAKIAAHWIQGELLRRLQDINATLQNSPIEAPVFAQLMKKLKENAISASAAKKIIQLLPSDDNDIDKIIDAHGMRQVDNDDRLQEWVDEVFTTHKTQVAAYLNGQTKMLGFLVGQVLKHSKGKANPKKVSAIIEKKCHDNEDNAHLD